ncbi:MAG: hypothetical protein M3367_02530 [Acidobacteriota bacterium]|nr:hypothetical protein [Acidobacteriota bacterium]
MSKNSFLKDIQANAAWDGIKLLLQGLYILGGAIMSTGAFAAFLHLFTVVSLDWMIIIGLFLLSSVLIVITYLFASLQKISPLTEEIKEVKTKEGEFKQPFNVNNSNSLVEVRNRNFTNEKVVLDGFHYTDCKFTNVKFVYNGTAYSGLSHNEIEGAYFSSENVAVSVTCALLRGLGYMKPEIPLYGENEKPLDNIKPPKIK